MSEAYTPYFFLFGIIIFLGAFAWFRFRESGAKTVQGIRYWYRQSRSKHKILDSSVTVETKWDHRLQFRPQGFWENLFIRNGWTFEFKTGDPHFDNKIFIESDDASFCKRFLEDPKSREFLLKFFSELNGQKIAFSKNRLKLVQNGHHEESYLFNIAKDAHEAWNQQLINTRSKNFTTIVDQVVQGVLFLSFLVGGIGCLKIAFSDYPIMVEPFKPFLVWASLGLAAAMVALIFGVAALRTTSRGPRWFQVSFIGAVLAGPIFGSFMGHYGNVNWDRSKAQNITARISYAHYTTRRTKNGGRTYHYYFDLDDINIRPEDLLRVSNANEFLIQLSRIEVPFKVYSMAKIGSPLLIDWKPGRFHAPVITSLIVSKVAD